MSKEDDDLGFWGLASIIAATGIIIKISNDSRKETEKRKSIPITFPVDFDDDIFKDICLKEAKSIQRLKEIKVDGLSVSGEVKSNSGLSSWKFTADFYDYGRLSGKYWLSSANDESTLPSIFLSNVASEIKKIVRKYLIFAPDSSNKLKGCFALKVIEHFEFLGFKNIDIVPQKKGFHFFSKKDHVSNVEINGSNQFVETDLFDPMDKVSIYYYT